MHRKRSLILITAVLMCAVAVAGAACQRGSATLKVQSATIDTLKLAGVTYRLVAPPMDNLCPKAALPVAVCDGWYYFVEGKALVAKDAAGKPILVAMPILVATDPTPMRKRRAEVTDEQLCGSPTIGAITTVLDRCGFKVAHHFILGEYDAKKDVAVGLASTIEAITRQLTGFGAAVAPKEK